MSLTSEQARIAYAVTTSPQSFAIPFVILNASDIRVVVTVAGVDTPITPTVTGAGTNPSTAMVTGVTGYVGATLTIYRNLPITQPATYVPNDRFPAATTEQNFDRLTMGLQQMNERVNRAVRFPVTNNTNAELTLVSRRNKVLAFDSDGALSLIDPLSSVINFTTGSAIEAGNMASLRAVSVAGLVTGQVAGLMGYSSRGDGGHGAFYYDSTSVATDNIGTVVAPNVGSGRWLRIYTGAVHVEWFGAIPSAIAGAGVDCSAAFLAAITAFPIVQLGAGHYRLETKVSRNTSNCQIAGLGKDVTYLDWYGAGVALESLSVFGVGSSLGYIRWRDFTLTDFGTGTTKGFRLGLFTKGCGVDNVKIVNFDFGIDADNVYYSTLSGVDFEQCGVGLQFVDRCNDFECFNCTWTTGANPLLTVRHVQNPVGATANNQTVVFRDCAFDGQGTSGMLYLYFCYNLIIDGCYFEVYEGGGGLAASVIELGLDNKSVKITNNEMIGPGTGVFTGKWINITGNTNSGHTIQGNFQYRASGATFLTTVAGNNGIAYRNNRCDAGDGTIVAGTVEVEVVAIYYPPTTGTDELNVPCFKTRSAQRTVRVLFIPMEAVDMTGRSFRVYRKDTLANVLSYTFNSHSPNPVLDALEVVNCGFINALSSDVLLYAVIYKDGSALVTPQSTIVFEYFS